MLRRGIAFLLVSATASAAAAAEPARGAEGTWVVTVAGTQTTTVTRVRRTTDGLGCRVTRDDADTQTLRFTTRRAGRLLVRADGRAAATRVGVAVEARGVRTRERRVAGAAPECDAAPQSTERACRPAVVGGRAAVRLPSPSVVRLTGSLERRRDRARCAPALAPARPFLPASEGRFEGRRLHEPRAGRITLSGSMRFVDHLRGGVLRVTAIRWRIVLTRTS